MDRNDYRAILFDKDGVLVNSMETIYRAIRETLLHFGEAELSRKEFEREFWGRRLDSNLSRLFADCPSNRIEEMCFHYRGVKPKFEKLSELYPEVISTLEVLKERYSLGVVTNTPKDIAFATLRMLGVSQYFDTVVGGYETRPKPEPDPILKACELLDVDPEQSMFIGDTETDIEAGKAAGCTTVVVTTSKTKEELENIGGILVVDDLKEILEILEIV